MNKYITLIIVTALTLGVSAVEADSQSKTNKVPRAKAKASVEAKKKTPQTKKPNPAEARKKYAAAVKKIREAVKAGKLTEKQAKEKYAALRKKMAPNRGQTSRGDILKRFDKNKDGKLDDKERAAARKAISERRKSAGKRGPRSGDKRGSKRGERGPRKK